MTLRQRIQAAKELVELECVARPKAADKQRLFDVDALLFQALEMIPENGLCTHSWRFLRCEASDPFDPSIAIDRFYCVKCLERKSAPRDMTKALKPGFEILKPR